MRDNLVPRVFHLPSPKGAREGRPWFRLVTCLGDNYRHGRGPNLSEYCRRWCLLPSKPALWATLERSFDFTAKICHVYNIVFNISN